MYRQLLDSSPLLTFPLIALVIFFSVYVAIFIRTFAKKASAYDATAALPLHDDDTVRHGGP